MIDTTNQTKNMLERLGRATAAPHQHEVGKAHNPHSAYIWTLEIAGGIMPASELSPRTYRVSMKANGKTIGQKDIPHGQCRTQDDMDEFVAAMFKENAPKPKKEAA